MRGGPSKQRASGTGWWSNRHGSRSRDPDPRAGCVRSGEAGEEFARAVDAAWPVAQSLRQPSNCILRSHCDRAELIVPDRPCLRLRSCGARYLETETDGCFAVMPRLGGFDVRRSSRSSIVEPNDRANGIAFRSANVEVKTRATPRYRSPSAPPDSHISNCSTIPVILISELRVL